MSEFKAKLKAAWEWFITDHSLSAELERDIKAWRYEEDCKENPERSALYE